MDSQTQFSGPFAMEFENLYLHSQSDAVRRLIADGEITASDRAEAWALFAACGAQEGVDFVESDLRLGFISTDDAEGARREDVWVRCTDQGYHELVCLYEMMANNPDGPEFSTQLLACLRRNSLVDDSFTLAELDEILDDIFFWPADCNEAIDSGRFSACSVLESGGLSLESNPDWTDPPRVLPGGASLDYGLGEGCLISPW